MLTKDGLTIYDLDPNASELWAVAGPEGYDVKAIDPDNLPPGFRWITEPEWQEILAIRDMARDWAPRGVPGFLSTNTTHTTDTNKVRSMTTTMKETCRHCGNILVYVQNIHGVAVSPDGKGIRDSETWQLITGTPCGCEVRLAADREAQAHATQAAEDIREASRAAVARELASADDTRVVDKAEMHIDDWDFVDEPGYYYTRVGRLVKLAKNTNMPLPRVMNDGSGILWPGPGRDYVFPFVQR